MKSVTSSMRVGDELPIIRHDSSEGFLWIFCNGRLIIAGRRCPLCFWKADTRNILGTAYRDQVGFSSMGGRNS
jgi:hypothetical protein